MSDSFFDKAKQWGSNAATSVSYTHLRAHETPEHLVCRLLLEKKKTTPTHSATPPIHYNTLHTPNTPEINR